MSIMNFFKNLEDKIENFVESSLGTERAPSADTPADSRSEAVPRRAPARGPQPEAGAPGVPSEETPRGRATSVRPEAVKPLPSGPAPIRLEPLEIRKAVVNAVEAQVRLIDGVPSFPFNRVDVDLVCASEQQKAHLMAELEDAERLQLDLERLFRTMRMHPEPVFALYLHYLSPAKVLEPERFRDGFRVECTREQATVRMARPDVARFRLKVEVGDASPSDLPLKGQVINLGRLAEARDAQGRILRRNQLVFQDEGEVNKSVSRLHAHLESDGEQWRLFDDQSVEGTIIMRAGRRIQVPSGGRRGVLIEGGDEIWLGTARIAVEKM